MSDNSQTIVDIDVGPEDAVRLAEDVRTWLAGEHIIQPDLSDCIVGEARGYAPGPGYAAAAPGDFEDLLLRLGRNGVHIQVGRNVFDSGSNGLELTCAACGTVFEPTDEWIEAVDAWFKGDDSAAFACPSCDGSKRLAEWRGPWPWGFGYLGVTFWNWPPLSDDFVSAVGRHLQHRIVLVRGHL